MALHARPDGGPGTRFGASEIRKGGWLIPPAPPPGTDTDGTLTDADLDAYDKALDAFLAGNWTAAYKHLHHVPPDDRGKDVLTEFILKNNRTPPPGWDGVIPLGSKG